MVPVEWPIAAADQGGGHPAARVAGGDRLRVVRADFFLDPGARLTEQERALMASMLGDLVAGLADDFAVLLGLAEAANDEETQLFDRLWQSGLLDIPDLLRLLLRRAEEERLSAAVRAGRTTSGSRFLQSFVGDEDAEVSCPRTPARPLRRAQNCFRRSQCRSRGLPGQRHRSGPSLRPGEAPEPS
jgi:hypothetical protein